jgi:xylose isomerase
MRDLRPQAIRRDADELLKHLKAFSVEPKFSAGVWFFAPGGGRFHDRYVDPMTTEQILETAAGLAEYGLKGLEAHYPKEVNPDRNMGVLEAYLTRLAHPNAQGLSPMPSYQKR